MSTDNQVKDYLKERFHGEFKAAIMDGTIGSPNALYYYVRNLMMEETIDYAHGTATKLVEFAIVKYLSGVRWSHIYYSLKTMGTENQPSKSCITE